MPNQYSPYGLASSSLVSHPGANTLIVPITSAARAPAPTALPTTATATATSSPATVAGAAGAVLACVRGRAHEGEVDVDGLVEELGVVGAVDGGAGLLEGGVLDECVALFVT